MAAPSAKPSATPLAALPELPAAFTFPKTPGGPYAVCSVGNGEIWVSTHSKQLINYDAAGNVLKTFATSKYIGELVYLNGVLYGSTGTELFTIDIDTGEMVSLEVGYAMDQIEDMVVFGDNLLLLCVPEGQRDMYRQIGSDLGLNAKNCEVVAYEIETQTAAIYGMELVVRITPGANGNAQLFGYETGGQVYTAELDASSKSLGRKTYLSISWLDDSIVCDSETDDIYWFDVTKKTLNAIFADEPGKVYPIMQDAELPGGATLMCADGCLYTLSVWTKADLSLDSTIYRRIITKPEVKALQIDVTFGGNYGVQFALWERISADYHGLTENMVSIESKFTSREQMITAILSGASDVDAFIMTANEAYAFGLPDNGCFTPLSGEAMSRFYDGTFDWIKEHFTVEGSAGAYWAIPLDMDSTKIYYNQAKLAASRYTSAIFKDYQAFWDAGAELARSGETRFSGSLYMGYAPLWQYVSRGMSDSALLRRAVSHTAASFAAADAASIVERVFPNGQEILKSVNFTDCVFALNDDLGVFSSVKSHALSGYAIAPLPQIDSSMEAMNAMQMNILFINPNSTNKEALLQFVECAAKAHLAPKLASESQPWTPILLKEKSVYKNVYDINSDLFNSLHDYNSKGFVPTVPFEVEMYVEAFIDGEADLDATVFTIERYLEMLERERQ